MRAASSHAANASEIACCRPARTGMLHMADMRLAICLALGAAGAKNSGLFTPFQLMYTIFFGRAVSVGQLQADIRHPVPAVAVRQAL